MATKVNINDDMFTIAITTKKDIQAQVIMTEAVKLMNTLSDMLRSNKTEEAQENVSVTPVPVRSRKKTTVVKKDDEFKVRDRLPNQIDLNDYSFKKAESKAVLLRCPACGQGHVVMTKVGSLCYILEKKNGKFEIIGESSGTESFGEFSKTFCMKDDETHKEYYDMMQKCDIIESDDFACSDEMDMFCPVCKSSAPMSKWVDAYENPSLYFEYNDVCDICGGENIVLSNKDDKTNYFKCENCDNIITAPLESTRT